MKCPHCESPLSTPLPACPQCGFSAEALGAYLGDHWVRLERITDAAHCLRLDDTRLCEVMMDDFERVFPQAFFAVYLGMLPTGLNVAELGVTLDEEQCQVRVDINYSASALHCATSLAGVGQTALAH